MDAIKKKMQAMKVEKDNAMDRADVCEQAAKDAKVWISLAFCLHRPPRVRFEQSKLKKKWQSW